MKEMLYICTVQYGSHKPHVTTKTKELKFHFTYCQFILL